jgi:hypothetical protein
MFANLNYFVVILEILEVLKTSNPDWVMLIFAPSTDKDGVVQQTKAQPYRAKHAKDLKLKTGSKIQFTEA